MDAYPAHYIAHNIPLILLSGLGTPDPNAVDETEQQYKLIQANGIRVSSDLPDVTGTAAESLLDCFQHFDAQNAAWNNRPGQGKLGSMGFTYRCVGRPITFPPHKDLPPAAMTESVESSGSRRQSSIVLHSPLSPLSSSSPLYPDGLMSPLWFTKHQLLLPSVLATFFSFTHDPDRLTLEDNRLRSEINVLKTSIFQSGYKTRLIVILVAESDALDPTAAERVANLRRATALDAKSLYHLPGYTTPVELRAFVGNLLSSLQPACVEYYRDLSKHARRKRNKGATPPPTVPPGPGSRHPISSQGWTVRYETKLGTFAEFRQEMDAAGRSYETAYENLLDGNLFDDLEFENPRFHEQRLLADILALRIIRCLLWTGQTTSAVQSWLTHRNRIRDLIEQKSGATDSYGWHAWDARWTKMMAELIKKVDLPVFHTPDLRSPGAVLTDYPLTFAAPERGIPADGRLNPWESLHHQGYWLGRSAAQTRTRRILAREIPPEDKELSAEAEGSESDIFKRYVCFLCPKPHEEQEYDYSSELIGTLKASDRQFTARGQPRASERARLEIGLEHVRNRRWTEATDVLKPLWQTLSWRQAQWWDLVFAASSAIQQCAAEVGDWEMYLAAQWELLSSCLPSPTDSKNDFHSCLDGFELSREPHASLNFDNLAPTFTAGFCFSKARGNAGVAEPAQLTLTFSTHAGVAPITLDDLTVAMEGNIKGLKLTHDASVKPVAERSAQTQLFELAAPEAAGSTQSADLTFAPGQTKVFGLKLIPREAGEVRASSATLKLSGNGFVFDMSIPLLEPAVTPVWWEPHGGSLTRTRLPLERPCALTVLAKPPKLKLELASLRKIYYSDELVELEVTLQNGEEDTAKVKLNVTLSAPGDSVPTLYHGAPPADVKSPTVEQSPSRLEDHDIGELAPKGTAKETVSFGAVPGFTELFLVVRADYFLVSDAETPVTVILKEKLTCVRALEASCTFQPLLDAQPWPSYFAVDEGGDDSAHGVRHRWAVAAKIASFAQEPLVLESATLEVLNAKYGVRCEVEESSGGEVPVLPDEPFDRTFGLLIQKLGIDDRRAALVSLQLRLTWRREGAAQATVSTLAVPSLTVPFGEPRVLCTAKPSRSKQPHMVNLSYVLENPSTHLLSFSVTMETSDEFAFSGPKVKVLQLVPLSRAEIRYNLMPFAQGLWVHPYLRVTDTGFGQELKVVAVEGCQNDKKAVAVWIDAE